MVKINTYTKLVTDTSTRMKTTAGVHCSLHVHYRLMDKLKSEDNPLNLPFVTGNLKAALKSWKTQTSGEIIGQSTDDTERKAFLSWCLQHFDIIFLTKCSSICRCVHVQAFFSSSIIFKRWKMMTSLRKTNFLYKLLKEIKM